MPKLQKPTTKELQAALSWVEKEMGRYKSKNVPPGVSTWQRLRGQAFALRFALGWPEMENWNMDTELCSKQVFDWWKIKLTPYTKRTWQIHLNTRRLVQQYDRD